MHYPWKNKDERMKTAYRFLKGHRPGDYVMYKATRAGCTTAMVAGFLNFMRRFLIVVPTNDIATKTIMTDAEKYSDRDSVNIIQVPSNHFCVKNQQMCEEHPDLKMLPVLPLADKCDECEEFNSCPVTEILRYGPTGDGIVLTYHKLIALMLASRTRAGTTAEEVLEMLYGLQDVVFDEVHEIQYGRAVSLTVYDNTKKYNLENIDKYMPIVDDFPHLAKVLASFSMFTGEPEYRNAVTMVFNDAQDDDYYKRKLSKKVPNHYQVLGHMKAGADVILGSYVELISLTINRKTYGLTMRDILRLYEILAVSSNPTVVVHAIKERGDLKINVVAVDNMFKKMLKDVVQRLGGHKKRVVLTSATICSHDYDQYFGINKPEHVMFGHGGDPMQSNMKMLILADSKRLHATGRNAFFARKDEIVRAVVDILDMYGDDDCMIIALNQAHARQVYAAIKEIRGGRAHAVTYYKAPDTMGVSNRARVLIAIGAAEKPSNAFDAICSTVEDSRILREESVHSDTWQAWSRVKDPGATVPSVVFALGVTEETCQHIVTWGIGRKVHIGTQEAGKRKPVTVECIGAEITRPNIKKCNGIDSMLAEAHLHKPLKYIAPEIIKKPLLYYNIIRAFNKARVQYNNKVDLLKRLVHRTDVYAEQAHDGQYFKVSGSVTDTLLQNHIAGKITVGAYALDTDNSVRWVCFDIDAHEEAGDTADDVVERQRAADAKYNVLQCCLGACGIPHICEASGTEHSYHIWIMLDPAVPALVAKSFAKALLEIAEVDGVEVYPKQTTLRRNKPYGNLVKLPFAINRKNGMKSMLIVNGHATEEIDELELGTIDISAWESAMPEKVQEKEVPGNMVPCGNGTVRPIFEWALDQKLTGSEGHHMRIAIVREYYNNGLTDPGALARLFIKQPDYDFEKSLSKVHSIISEQIGCWRYTTLLEHCKSLVLRFEAEVVD